MVIQFSLRFLGHGDHFFEQDLERHAVTTSFVGNKKFTVTVENTVFETDIMLVIVTVESDVEFVEPEAFAVFRVAFGLLEFADQS